MNLRDIINIVEGLHNPVVFDEKTFFQHLVTLVQEIRASIKRGNVNDEVRNELKILIREMIRLIRQGKKTAYEAYEPDRYKEFVKRVETMVSQSGIDPSDLPSMDMDEPEKTAPELKPVNSATAKSNELTKQQTAPNPQEKWQVTNLAVKRTNDKKNESIGVAKQDGNFYTFQGVTGGKYAVKLAIDLSAAQKQFYHIVHQEGYTEISPGSYGAIRNGDNIGGSKSHFTPIRHNPPTNPDNIPTNAKVWR